MVESISSAQERSPTAAASGRAVEDAAVAAVPWLTTDEVWRVLDRASAAVVGYVTPAGAPRTSAVVYAVVDRRLYVAVAPDSWKARHIATGDQVSITALVRRGGVLSLLFPIPPATITFHGLATVYPAGSPEMGPLLARLETLLPPERHDSACLIGVAPKGGPLSPTGSASR
jgi:hypothetical protein